MNHDRRKLRIRLVALLPLFFLTGCLFYGGFYNSYCQYLVIYDHAVGTATLTGENWGGHGHYNYRYMVDGKEYTGVSRRDYHSKKYGDARAGDKVPAYYSVQHPSVSFLYVPEAVIIGLPFFVVVFFFWLLFVITVINPDSGWAMNLEGKGRASAQSSSSAV